MLFIFSSLSFPFLPFFSCLPQNPHGKKSPHERNGRKKNGQLYEGQGERLGLTALLRRTIQKNGHVPRGKSEHTLLARHAALASLGSACAPVLPSAWLAPMSLFTTLFDGPVRLAALQFPTKQFIVLFFVFCFCLYIA